MEFHSPVYELLYRCEQMGMRLPRGWDLMPADAVLDACRAFLGVSHGHGR
jgi:hypothetical protein